MFIIKEFFILLKKNDFIFNLWGVFIIMDIIKNKESKADQEKDFKSNESITNDLNKEIRSEIELIKSKLEEQNKLANEYLDLLQRSQAEFINYKSRVEKEIKELVFIEKKETILNFIQFKETLKTAYDHETNDQNKQNILQLINNFDILLKRLNVKKMDVLNSEFDFNFHECLFKKEVINESEDNKIIEVMEDGYLLDKKLLKPAKVIVGNYIKKN